MRVVKNDAGNNCNSCYWNHCYFGGKEMNTRGLWRKCGFSEFDIDNLNLANDKPKPVKPTELK